MKVNLTVEQKSFWQVAWTALFYLTVELVEEDSLGENKSFGILHHAKTVQPFV